MQLFIRKTRENMGQNLLNYPDKAAFVEAEESEVKVTSIVPGVGYAKDEGEVFFNSEQPDPVFVEREIPD